MPGRVGISDRSTVNLHTTAAAHLRTDAQLRAAATHFVVQNSGTPRWGEAHAALYPGPTEGNNGTFAYLLSGADATRLAAIGNAYGKTTRPPTPLSFDPRKQQLLVVRDSQDEVRFWLAVVDRKTGRVTPFSTGQMKLDDVSMRVDQKTYAKVFPGNGDVGMADGWATLEPLFRKGAALDIGNPRG